MTQNSKITDEMKSYYSDSSVEWNDELKAINNDSLTKMENPEDLSKEQLIEINKNLLKSQLLSSNLLDYLFKSYTELVREQEEKKDLISSINEGVQLNNDDDGNGTLADKINFIYDFSNDILPQLKPLIQMSQDNGISLITENLENLNALLNDPQMMKLVKENMKKQTESVKMKQEESKRKAIQEENNVSED